MVEHHLGVYSYHVIGDQANKLMFLMSWLTKSCSSSLVSEVPIIVICWNEGLIMTSFKSYVGVILSFSTSILGPQ